MKKYAVSLRYNGRCTIFVNAPNEKAALKAAMAKAKYEVPALNIEAEIARQVQA